MRELTVSYLGKKAFKINVREHEFITDQPLTNEGENKGPTPAEFLIASLGGCIGVYAVGFLKRLGLDPSNIEIRISWSYEKLPSRIGKINIEVKPGIVLPEEELPKLHKIIEGCLVHKTLTIPPEIDINIVE